MYLITANLIDKDYQPKKAPGVWETITSGTYWNIRLLDDDRNIYFEGISQDMNESADVAFAPLDDLKPAFGVTELQYFEAGSWNTL
jgi:hypothetical protein